MSLAGAFWVKLAQAAEPGTPSSHDGKATAAAVPVVCEELRKRPWTHPDAGPAGVVDVALSVAQGTRHHDKGALDKLLEYTLGDPASTTVDRGMAMPLQVHRFDPPATHNAGSFMGGGPGGRRTLEASLATPRSMRRQSSDNVNATSPRARTVQNVTKKSFPYIQRLVAEFHHYDARAATADSITAHLERLNTMAARLNTAQRAWVESKAKIVPAMRKRTDNEFKTHQRAIVHMQYMMSVSSAMSGLLVSLVPTLTSSVARQVDDAGSMSPKAASRLRTMCKAYFALRKRVLAMRESNYRTAARLFSNGSSRKPNHRTPAHPNRKQTHRRGRRPSYQAGSPTTGHLARLAGLGGSDRSNEIWDSKIFPRTALRRSQWRDELRAEATAISELRETIAALLEKFDSMEHAKRQTLAAKAEERKAAEAARQQSTASTIGKQTARPFPNDSASALKVPNGVPATTASDMSYTIEDFSHEESYTATFDGDKKMSKKTGDDASLSYTLDTYASDSGDFSDPPQHETGGESTKKTTSPRAESEYSYDSDIYSQDGFDNSRAKAATNGAQAFSKDAASPSHSYSMDPSFDGAYSYDVDSAGPASFSETYSVEDDKFNSLDEDISVPDAAGQSATLDYSLPSDGANELSVDGDGDKQNAASRHDRIDDDYSMPDAASVDDAYSMPGGSFDDDLSIDYSMPDEEAGAASAGASQSMVDDYSLPDDGDDSGHVADSMDHDYSLLEDEDGAVDSAEDNYSMPDDVTDSMDDNYSMPDDVAESMGDGYSLPDDAAESMEDNYSLPDDAATSMEDDYTLPDDSGQAADSMDHDYSMPDDEDGAGDSLEDNYSLPDDVTNSMDDNYSLLDDAAESMDDTYSLPDDVAESMDGNYSLPDDVEESMDDNYSLPDDAAESMDDNYSLPDDVAESMGDDYSLPGESMEDNYSLPDDAESMDDDYTLPDDMDDDYTLPDDSGQVADSMDHDYSMPDDEDGAGDTLEDNYSLPDDVAQSMDDNYSLPDDVAQSMDDDYSLPDNRAESIDVDYSLPDDALESMDGDYSLPDDAAESMEDNYSLPDDAAGSMEDDYSLPEDAPDSMDDGYSLSGDGAAAFESMEDNYSMEADDDAADGTESMDDNYSMPDDVAESLDDNYSLPDDDVEHDGSMEDVYNSMTDDSGEHRLGDSIGDGYPLPDDNDEGAESMEDNFSLLNDDVEAGASMQDDYSLPDDDVMKGTDSLEGEHSLPNDAEEPVSHSASLRDDDPAASIGDDYSMLDSEDDVTLGTSMEDDYSLPDESGTSNDGVGSELEPSDYSSADDAEVGSQIQQENAAPRADDEDNEGSLDVEVSQLQMPPGPPDDTLDYSFPETDEPGAQVEETPRTNSSMGTKNEFAVLRPDQQALIAREHALHERLQTMLRRLKLNETETRALMQQSVKAPMQRSIVAASERDVPRMQSVVEVVTPSTSGLDAALGSWESTRIEMQKHQQRIAQQRRLLEIQRRRRQRQRQVQEARSKAAHAQFRERS